MSRYALARVDLDRMRYSAEEQTNWMPRVFGPMMLRPGLQSIGYQTKNNVKAVAAPFIRATDDAAWLEFTPEIMRVFKDEAPITRANVSTTITNPAFTGSIAGWTTADELGATTAYDAPNKMGMTGTGFNAAIAYQAVSVILADRGVEHGIRVAVSAGPVGLRIGTALGLDDLQSEVMLDAGTYSFAITPNAATFYIYFFNRKNYKVDLDRVAIESPGDVTIPTPWEADDLSLLRWDQSADVFYVCDGSNQQRKVMHFADRSWGISLYAPINGPFRVVNFSQITLTPSDTHGDISLVASGPVFKDGHVGGLFRLSSSSQDITADLSGDGQFSDPIRISGTGDGRDYTYTISGTWVGDLVIQRSISAPGAWVDVHHYTANTSVTGTDGLDNQIVYYRIGFKDPGDYVSGTAHVELIFQSGSITGVVRILTVSNSKNATARVLTSLGDAKPTTIWYEGFWSDYRGWPTSVALDEGRLTWNGRGYYWLSVSDGYESFDDTVVGDSGPITRSIGKGPVDSVNWTLSLQRLVAATDGQVITARSDSIDTPLTPTNFNLKFPVSQGAARIAAVGVDDAGYFVHRTLSRIYELALGQTGYASIDYSAKDITEICPELCAVGIVKIVVQRQPDTRIHAILADGTVALYVMDRLEQIGAFIKVETPGLGGFVEDAIVLPSFGTEDAVYYIVRRTVAAGPLAATQVRNYEKWATETACVGGNLNRQADAFTIFHAGSPTTHITGLPGFLIGSQVIVWADGKDLSPGPYTEPTGITPQVTYLVTDDGSGAGQITLGTAVSAAIVGLPYEARFKGVKLAYAATMGTALTMRKTVSGLGLIAADIHSDGVRYGPDYDSLQEMPKIKGGAPTSYDDVYPDFDEIEFPFSDKFGTDSRICLKAYAPRPVRIMGLVPTIDTEK